MFEKEFHFFMKAMYYSKIIDDIIIAVVLSSLVIWVGGYFLKVKNLYKTIATVIAIILSILIVPIPYKREIEQARQKKIAKYNERKAKYEAAKAVFDEQCKQAGEKIYRTVDNVDGIMLLKVRGREEHEIGRDWGLAADPMWSHAAIAELEIGDYVRNFFGFGDKKTYLFVDVLEKDGSVSRYLDGQRRDKDVPIKNPSNPARYAVTYENNIDPELRKHWVAGITIKIIDRQTDELLAEKTIFTFESALGSKATGRQPWLHRPEHCPELSDMPTRAFAFQVLKFSQPLNSQE